MANWGTPWGLGLTWGLPPAPGPAALCTASDARVLVQMDDDPANRKFRDFLCDLVHDAGVFQDVALDVQGAYDLAVAQGFALDAVGSFVGLTRQGVDDNDYRRYLQIQVELLISAARDEAKFTGTHANILTIARKFIGTGVALPIWLQNLPPYFIVLNLPSITVPEAQILVGFIRLALFAAVDGVMLLGLSPSSQWDSVSVGPLPNGGIWGSASVAIPGPAKWGSVVVI